MIFQVLGWRCLALFGENIKRGKLQILQHTTEMLQHFSCVLGWQSIYELVSMI